MDERNRMLTNTVNTNIVKAVLMDNTILRICNIKILFYNNVVNNKKLLDVCKTKTKYYKENNKQNDEY